MIIYGTRSTHLKSAQAKSIACAHCGQTDTTVLSVYSKHVHIFWIPIFPIGSTGYSLCTHCKQEREHKNMPQDLQRESKNLKAETKPPIWQFTGLGVIALLIGFSIYSSGQSEKNQAAWVANPMAGDIYSYKTEDKNYSTMKVVSVSGDSVFVSPNQYQTDKVTGVYKIDKAENYGEESYGISRSGVKQMLADGEIYDIDRN